MNSYIEKDALYVLRKYPTKVPVMVQKDIRCTLIADLPKRKFIVPKDLQISDFLYYIRRQLQVPEFESIFICIYITFFQIHLTCFDDTMWTGRLVSGIINLKVFHN